jgi:hypothetical protein
MIGYTITRDTDIDLAHIEIPEDLRRQIAQAWDEMFMRAAFGGPAPAPTTLYVDKRGHYSTVDPKAEAAFAHRNRAPFGFVVST